MALWQPAHDTNWHRILIAVGLVLTLAVGGVLAVSTMADPARAQTSIDGLTVQPVNETVDGVSDVELAATLRYDVNVPDAEMRVIELKAGPTKDNLGTVTFDHEGNPTGTGAGSVTLTGSLLDAGTFTKADFEPAMAETKTTDVVVAATIRVDRANGETVTETVTETTTVTLQDSTNLTTNVGGTVEIHVVE